MLRSSLNSALWSRALVEQNRALGGVIHPFSVAQASGERPRGSIRDASTLAMSPSRLIATATSLAQVIPLERARSAPPGSPGRIETAVRPLLGWRRMPSSCCANEWLRRAQGGSPACGSWT